MTLEELKLQIQHNQLTDLTILDSIPHDESGEGTTLLWQLVAKGNIDVLEAHPDFLQGRNLDASPVHGKYADITVLYMLVSRPEGQAILQANPELLQGRNLDASPVHGKYAGITVLYMLVTRPEGLAILQANPELLQGRNLDASPVHGKYAGITVLWFLAATPVGLAILQANPELLQGRNLDASFPHGRDAGRTVLYMLVTMPEGLAILQANPELLQGRNLDASPVHGPDAGRTVLWFLAATPVGRNILQTKPELLQGRNLDASPVHGKYAGITVLYMLVTRPEGLAILQANPELLQGRNLDASPVHGKYAGKTVLYMLVTMPEGLAILQANPELLQGRNLDASPVHGPDAGRTVLWFLAATPVGRNILQTKPELLQGGNLDASPVHGKYAGKTVLYMLVTRPEGQAILQTKPELLQGGNLDASPAHGLNAGKTVLWCLAATDVGLAILQAKPELLQGRNLDASPAHRLDAGKTVLLCLAATHVGLAILQANPKLLQGRNLDASPAHGRNAGKTVLLFLADSPKGRAILQADPSLLYTCKPHKLTAPIQKKLLTQIFASDDAEVLQKSLLVLYPQLTISELDEPHRSKALSMQKAIELTLNFFMENIIYASSTVPKGIDSLGHDNISIISYFYFLSQHPELDFMSREAFESRIFTPRLEKFQPRAHKIIDKNIQLKWHTEHTLGPSLKNNREFISQHIIMPALKELTNESTLPSYIDRNLREIIYWKTRLLERLAKSCVKLAIKEAVEQHQSLTNDAKLIISFGLKGLTSESTQKNEHILNNIIEQLTKHLVEGDINYPLPSDLKALMMHRVSMTKNRVLSIVAIKKICNNIVNSWQKLQSSALTIVEQWRNQQIFMDLLNNTRLPNMISSTLVNATISSTKNESDINALIEMIEKSPEIIVNKLVKLTEDEIKNTTNIKLIVSSSIAEAACNIPRDMNLCSSSQGRSEESINDNQTQESKGSNVVPVPDFEPAPGNKRVRNIDPESPSPSSKRAKLLSTTSPIYSGTSTNSSSNPAQAQTQTQTQTQTQQNTDIPTPARMSNA